MYLKRFVKESATVLVGEFDEQTYCGNVTAYTWFPEGWAKYPILHHGGKREDKYFFQLRLPGDRGLSRQAVKTKQTNRKFIERIQIFLKSTGQALQSVCTKLERIEKMYFI